MINRPEKGECSFESSQLEAKLGLEVRHPGLWFQYIHASDWPHWVIMYWVITYPSIQCNELSGVQTVGKRMEGLWIKGKKLSLARRTERELPPGEGEPILRLGTVD